MKFHLVFLLIVVLALFFGCTEELSVSDAAKNDSTVNSFLSQHPNATITSGFMEASGVLADPEFKTNCAAANAEDAYKVLFNDSQSGDEAVAFVSLNKEIICSYKKAGSNENCAESWSCTSWNPKVCDKSGKQSRVCSDISGCKTTNNKPAEEQTCVYMPSNTPVGCTENWTCGQWTSCADGVQTRACTDTNACGTMTLVPSLSKSCVLGCTENWVCGDWTLCSAGLQTRICNDANDCGTTRGRPATTQTCTMACTPNWICDDWGVCNSGIQTRTCFDSKGCGVETSKPTISQACGESPIFTDAISINSVILRTPSYAFDAAAPESECLISITKDGLTTTGNFAKDSTIYSSLSTNRGELKLSDCFTAKATGCYNQYEASITISKDGLTQTIRKTPQFMLNSVLTSFQLSSDVNIQSAVRNLSTENAELYLNSEGISRIVRKGESLSLGGGTITLDEMYYPACDENIMAMFAYTYTYPPLATRYAYASTGTQSLSQSFIDQNGYFPIYLGDPISVTGGYSYSGKSLSVWLEDVLQTGISNMPFQGKWKLTDAGTAIKYVQSTPPNRLREDFGTSYIGEDVNVLTMGHNINFGTFFGFVKKK